MELYKNRIPIGNIYYMLSYAFKDLQQQSVVSVKPEEFDNIHQIMAEIIIGGVSYQLKKGMFRNYETCQEELIGIRGKIDIADTINCGSGRRRKLVCSYDEYTENTLLNQILKSVMLLLLCSELREGQAVELRRLVRYFSDITEIDLYSVRWDSLVYNRNYGEYRLLMSVCRIICENMLHSTEEGDVKLVSFSESYMHHLYEKFLLNYYIKHYSHLKPASAEIKWAAVGDVGMLPNMQSDIMLTGQKRRLIIDAKFYSHSTQRHHDRESFHSHNLYQIFTYVKNEAMHYDGEVSGMLLYAKTLGDMIPGEGAVFNMSGNRIAVRSLDLSGDFKSIARQLNELIADYHMD